MVSVLRHRDREALAELLLGVAAIASGVLVLALTLAYEEVGSYDVFLFFGSAANILCGGFAIRQSNIGRRQQYQRNPSAGRAYLLAFLIPALLWNIAMMIGGAVGGNNPNSGLNIALLVDSLGILFVILWLALRLTWQPAMATDR